MVLCAALKLSFAGEFSILPCHRHADGYHFLRDFDISYKD